MKFILTVSIASLLPVLALAQTSPVDGPSPKTQPVEPILEKDHSGPGRIGVRVVIAKDTGLPVIVSLTRGGPADDYGFKVGDVIVKIDRNFTSTLTPDQIKLALHGEPGSGVELTVQRGDDPRLIVHSIERRVLPENSVEIPESTIMTEPPVAPTAP
jgi:C-terminal processing protease CtpA/Prc